MKKQSFNFEFKVKGYSVLFTFHSSLFDGLIGLIGLIGYAYPLAQSPLFGRFPFPDNGGTYGGGTLISKL